MWVFGSKNPMDEKFYDAQIPEGLLKKKGKRQVGMGARLTQQLFQWIGAAAAILRNTRQAGRHEAAHQWVASQVQEWYLLWVDVSLGVQWLKCDSNWVTQIKCPSLFLQQSFSGLFWCWWRSYHLLALHSGWTRVESGGRQHCASAVLSLLCAFPSCSEGPLTAFCILKNLYLQGFPEWIPRTELFRWKSAPCNVFIHTLYIYSKMDRS